MMKSFNFLVLKGFIKYQPVHTILKNNMVECKYYV